MPANHSNTNLIAALIHSTIMRFKTFLYVATLCYYGREDIIALVKIFDVKANENASFKRNELEFRIKV